MRLTLYQIIVVHLGQPDMVQVLDLLRVSPDDLFPVGSDKIQSYAELVNVAIAPDNPRAHIAAEVTLDMLRSEEFTIGNDLPASVAGSNVRNGPLEPDVMYTLFYRGLSDGQRGKRQVNPGTDRLVQTSSFQPLQMTDPPQSTESLTERAALTNPMTESSQPEANTGDEEGNGNNFYIIGAAVGGGLLLLLLLAIGYLVKTRSRGREQPDAAYLGKSGAWHTTPAATVMANPAVNQDKKQPVENIYTVGPSATGHAQGVDTPVPAPQPVKWTDEPHHDAAVTVNTVALSADTDDSPPPETGTFLGGAERPKSSTPPPEDDSLCRKDANLPDTVAKRESSPVPPPSALSTSRNQAPAAAEDETSGVSETAAVSTFHSASNPEVPPTPSKREPKSPQEVTHL